MKDYFLCLWRVWSASDPDRAHVEPVVYCGPQADPESVAREIFKDARLGVPDSIFFERRKIRVVVSKIPEGSVITDRLEFSQKIRDCYTELFRSALAKSAARTNQKLSHA